MRALGLSNFGSITSVKVLLTIHTPCSMPSIAPALYAEDLTVGPRTPPVKPRESAWGLALTGSRGASWGSRHRSGRTARGTGWRQPYVKTHSYPGYLTPYPRYSSFP